MTRGAVVEIMSLDEVKWGVCGRGEMWETMLEDGLEALAGLRCPLPMKGRSMMCLNKSAMEQGVRS